MIRLPPNATIEDIFAQAIALHNAGEFQAAEAFYRALMKLAPEQAGIPYNLGALLQRQGRSEEAAEAFKLSLSIRPLNADAHNNLGVALQSLGRDEEAIAAFHQALALKPDSAEAHRNLGIGLRRLGQLEEAVAAFHQATTLRPGHAESWAELGRTLHEQERPDEAIEAYLKAQALKPDWAELMSDLGAAYELCGRSDEAIAQFRAAIAIAPDFAHPYNNLGKSLEALGDLDAAEEAFQQALKLNPQVAEFHGNFGNVQMSRRRIDDGIDCYRRAVELKPDFFEGHVSLGMALLTQGHLKEGWAEWEWRWYRRSWLTPSLLFQRPLKPGERLDGKTVLLFAEQGFGDALQFCRYADALTELGARVVVKTYRPLLRLTQTLASAAEVIAVDEDEPHSDLRLPMMSAPYVFSGAIPNRHPYLSAEPDKVAAWRQRLSALPGFKVGLVWAGDPRPHDPGANRVDRRRSMRLDQFAPLAAVPGVSFISLQKGSAAAQGQNAPFPLFDAMDEMGDFADTAALTAALDLVISVDTSMVHLAGALGVPCWMASRFDGCWRWGETGDASPWYPHLRIFRQGSAGDWSDVTSAMAAMLPVTIGNHSPISM